ncbi:MAG: DNA cytosine methyltransferase [Ignavibacteria bacterium]|nr:DNA cytosine methyltransferase [Ignavibacteria bacterium]
MSDNNEYKIPILSFYSGGGFLDMGFEMSGFNIIWTNENDDIFAKLHSSGITSWRKSRGNGIKAEIFNTKSIIEVSSEDIITEAFNGKKPEIFGMIGGPPCQDFTMNGNLEGFRGERGKLTIIFFDKILEILPTFFVMENVTGLLKNKSNREYLAQLVNKLKNKYHIDYKTLNSLDYGVPQYRERVFFVGILKSFLPENFLSLGSFNFDWPVNNKYESSFKKVNWPKTNPFTKKITKPKNIPFDLCVKKCLVSKSKVNKIPNAKEYFQLFAKKSKLNKICEGETNRPSFKRLHRYRYSPTACYGNNEVHLHPFENRRISVREALRIQGVPDTYVLPEDLSKAKKFKMIGNGVPVPLAHEVAQSVYTLIIRCISNSQSINGYLDKR